MPCSLRSPRRPILTSVMSRWRPRPDSQLCDAPMSARYRRDGPGLGLPHYGIAPHPLYRSLARPYAGTSISVSERESPGAPIGCDAVAESDSRHRGRDSRDCCRESGTPSRSMVYSEGLSIGALATTLSADDRVGADWPRLVLGTTSGACRGKAASRIWLARNLAARPVSSLPSRHQRATAAAVSYFSPPQWGPPRRVGNTRRLLSRGPMTRANSRAYAGASPPPRRSRPARRHTVSAGTPRSCSSASESKPLVQKGSRHLVRPSLWLRRSEGLRRACYHGPRSCRSRCRTQRRRVTTSSRWRSRDRADFRSGTARFSCTSGHPSQ